jgi:hypothetical protein
VRFGEADQRPGAAIALCLAQQLLAPRADRQLPRPAGDVDAPVYDADQVAVA